MISSGGIGIVLRPLDDPQARLALEAFEFPIVVGQLNFSPCLGKIKESPLIHVEVGEAGGDEVGEYYKDSGEDGTQNHETQTDQRERFTLERRPPEV
jgi:hypothetical protein